MSDYVKIDSEDSILKIGFNRPDKKNALNSEMYYAVRDALVSASEDSSVRVIVLYGEGGDFTSGNDVKDFLAFATTKISEENDSEFPAKEFLDVLIPYNKPIIAAVNGAAVGIGVTMILPFDVIITSETAKFGFVFIKMGIVPELASTHFLVSRVGWGRANEMMLSGSLYSGEEAYRFGLAEYLVNDRELLNKAFEIGNQMAENPDRQLRMTKQLLTINSVTTDLKAAEELETKFLQECWETDEHQEAVTAFLEKRKPKFR